VLVDVTAATAQDEWRTMQDEEWRVPPSDQQDNGSMTVESSTAPAGSGVVDGRPTTPNPDDALQHLLRADGSAVAVIGLDGALHYVNDPGLALLGAESVDGLRPGTHAHALLRSFLDHVPQHLLHDPAGGSWHGDIDHHDPLGDHRIYRATVSVRHDAALRSGGTVSLLAHDVTAARDEAIRLRQRASHDPLTGLSNRRQILDILADAIADHRGQLGHVATVFVDLDRLKYVNDALGHRVGDRLLVSVAHRLAEAVRPDDHVARIGGDEFLVVCRNIPDALTALDVAERVRRSLTGRLRVNQFDLEFSVSIGVAMTDGDVMDLSNDDAAAALVGNADTAMYEAKSTGRGRCLLFTSQMRSAARERTELAGALAHSIGSNDISVV
jgi:diguanylate cyclase (GGDEF)-like protein